MNISSNYSNFITNIKHISPKTIKLEDAENLFRTLLSNFKCQLPIEVGIEILFAIGRLVSVKSFLENFLNNDFFPVLPFNQCQYSVGLRELLYIFITKSPNSFTDVIAYSFGEFIPYRGKDCLILLTNYFQRYQEITDPSPMINILFEFKSRFAEVDLLSPYCSLLSILTRTYADFRKSHGHTCWKIICECLATNFVSPSTIEYDLNAQYISKLRCNIYNAACGIADAIDRDTSESLKKVILPYESIARDINNPNVASAALSLMMFGTISEKFFNTTFLNNIIKLALVSKQATLALIKLSNYSEIAEMLLQPDCIHWMTKPIPTIYETLRLFLILFMNIPLSLQENFVKYDEFYIFLKLMIRSAEQNQDEKLHSIIGKILRRIHLTQEMVQNLSLAHIFAKFFTAGDEINSHMSIFSSLYLADHLGQSFFTKELVPICSLIVSVVEDDTFGLAEKAIIVGSHLLRYSKCEKKFRELNFESIVKKIKKHNSGDESLVRASNKFLKTLSKL